MKPVVARALALVALVILFGPSRPSAAEQLLGSSPGPLTASHGALDAQDHCNDCHVGDSKAPANGKCLACHEHQNLNARIQAGKGLHSSATVKGKKCESCHHEHKGKGYDLMGWSSIKSGENSFDHELTGWRLDGKHAATECKDCHKAKDKQGLKASMAIDRLCGGCHAKDSHHGNRFSQFGSPPKCETCHPSGGPKWTPNSFDHGGRTRFKLVFKHAEQSCRACHRGNSPSDFERFKFDPNKECMSCHEHAKVHSDDEHPNGKYKSSQCLQCHRTGEVNPIVVFAHGVNGTFPLIKRHKGVHCTECHTGRDAKDKTSFSGLKPSCNASGQCHEDPLHTGTLGERCMICHVSGTWDPLKFDHDQPFPKDAKAKVAAFPLKGEHRKPRCEACHPERKFAGTPSTCAAAGCHKDDDAHNGRLGDKCEQCHVETGDNLFNHNTMAAFKLDGKHLTVRCAGCHPSVTFKPRPRDCFGCHREPAVHRGQYGTGCAQCHTTRTWGDGKPLHDVGAVSLNGG